MKGNAIKNGRIENLEEDNKRKPNNVMPKTTEMPHLCPMESPTERTNETTEKKERLRRL